MAEGLVCACPTIMKRDAHVTSRSCVLGWALRGHAFLAFAGFTSFLACKDPIPGLDTSKTHPPRIDASPSTSDLTATFNEDCPAQDDWFPADGGPPPPVAMREPPAHPDTECPFYRGVVQNFLIAAHPDSHGDPDLVHYAALDDVFTSAVRTGFARNSGELSADPYMNPGGAMAAALVRKGKPTGKAWLGAVRQAGQRNILIDRNGHTLYYGLHMNQAFYDFVHANNLQTQAGILGVDPQLQFPPGVVEFKTAWQDIDPRDFPDAKGNYGTANGIVPPPTDFATDPGDYSNYITTMAWIPWLSQPNATTGTIEEDPDHPILRKMALIAIHCVYTFPGHPEFVWGSIQHVNVKEMDPDVQAFAGVQVLGRPDTTPSTTGPMGQPALPDPNDPQNQMVPYPPDAKHNYLMYAANTLERDSNKALPDNQLKFTEATQSFDKTQASSVYRVFPGSKANTLQPDTAVFSLNANLNVLFQNAPAADKRQHYRLVAAVWMDKPALFGLGPKQVNGSYPGLTLQNDDTNPLVQGALQHPPNVFPMISQGVTCGTPLGPHPMSGDAPGATGFNNTVPGCATRYDDLQLPDAGNPQSETDGGPLNPSLDFATHTKGTDSEFSILGGEDRLSSTVMETFTQNNTFHNCFACHNTQPINSLGVSADPTCLPPNPAPGCPVTLIPFAAKINVSHMFSEFILREQEAQARATARASGN
jgi:hypothetical protein